MTARRSSARLAMAVSSILAAPALVTGLGLAVGLAVAPEARAQETASQMAGYVVDAAGNPVAGAHVTVLHASSGTSSAVSTNDAGQFIVTGLRVGGPYTVSVSASGYQSSGIENVYTELGRRANVSVSLYPIAELGEVQITAASERATAIGVGTEFSAQKIAEMPAIDRDIKNTLRIDPKAWIDPTNVGAMEVAGVNNRYNSITVDGVRQSDDFGLENNGYPTIRGPISIDAIEAVSLLSAPFDVRYSSFRGSTINMVTKSGTNEFDGSLYYYKYSDSLVGDKSRDTTYQAQFDRKTYGATIGGPIIRDKLFFFASYEKLDESTPQEWGPADSSFPTKVSGVTQGEYEEIVKITDEVYGFSVDVGARPSSLPAEDEKILAKIDWNITDDHRMSLAYQNTEGSVVVPQNNSLSGAGRLSTPSDWYKMTIAMKTYSFQLFSNWNERFATEIKVARKEVEKLQEATGGTDFANFRIITPSGGEVYVGPDIFRHANYLTNDLDAIKLKGELFLGSHTLSIGYEKEMLDVFNLFIRRSEGEYQFSSIDNYRDRVARQLDYQNAWTNDENDGAASFGYDMNSYYLQDSWQVTEDFQLQYGLRYDTWSSSDVPRFNQNFQDRYGFSNQETLDGRDILMPRVGFNWQVSDNTLVHGGIGLFGGGTPNVWLANSYSNDGVMVVSQTITPSSPPLLALGLTNVNGYMINQDVQDSLKPLSGDGGVNAIHPDFKIPSQWRFNLGVEHTFDNDWKLTGDVMYSTVKDEIFYQDVRMVQTGTAPDGRPIYTSTNPTTRGGPGTQDLVLSSTSQGRALIFTMDLSKSWVTRAGLIDLYVGYGHQDVLDVNPGTSSQASSNWDYLATDDPNNPKLSTSNYEIEQRFTMAFNWRKDFFEDLFTSAGLYVERRSGRPFSYTFSGRSQRLFGDPSSSSRNRPLFYVPSGPTDVLYEGGMSWAQMEAYIQENGLTKYMGQIAPRNAFNSPWITIADLRLAQEIPTFIKGTRGVLTLDIENLANMIDSDWGRYESVGFPYTSPVSEVRIDSATGKYVYKPNSNQTGPQSPRYTSELLSSVWRIQLGIRFEF